MLPFCLRTLFLNNKSRSLNKGHCFVKHRKRLILALEFHYELLYFLDIKQPIRTPWRDLFIWAVLANRREMALLFLERGRENLAMALMATKLLKSLVAMALSSKDMMDIGADMLGHAE